MIFSFLFFFFFFFFNDTATTEIYTISLHDALPIYDTLPDREYRSGLGEVVKYGVIDRKSTRLNSSHVEISYAVFCLNKKKKQIKHRGKEQKQIKITDTKTYKTKK